MLPHITDLYAVANALLDRANTGRPDDVRLLGDARQLVQQMHFVMRLRRDEAARIVAAESWLDQTRVDRAISILAEVLGGRIRN
jgi:hypothetical protein